MLKILATFKYLHYLFRHKWFVFVECRKYGLVWRGIVHDWSKFLPDEFFRYVKHFYGKEKEPSEFKYAFLKHQNRHQHHWQWWVSFQDGKPKALPMSEAARIEMLCDWRGAGKAQGHPHSVREWYAANKGKMILHDETRAWVEKNL